MLRNVSVDVVDCTRVKDVFEVSVRPREQGRGLITICTLLTLLYAYNSVLTRRTDS